MDINSIFPILINTFLTAIFTLAIAYGTYKVKSKKANKVIFGKTYIFPLIRVSDLVKQNIAVTYRDKQLQDLIFYEFQITNQGEIDITNFEASITFWTGKPDSFLEIITADKQGKTVTDLERVVIGEDSDEYHCKLTRPYLNQIKQHQDEIVFLRVYTDSYLNFTICGGGEGWNAYAMDYRFTDEDTKKQLNTKLSLLGVPIGVFVLFCLITINSFTFIDQLFLILFLALTCIYFLLFKNYSYQHILDLFGYTNDKKKKWYWPF